MEEWFVVVNPLAARGNVKRRWKTIQKQLELSGIKFLHIVTSGRESAIAEIQNALFNGFRKFIAVGGDGSLNCLVNALCLQDKVRTDESTIAIIPAGTGNDWIKTHRIPKSASKAIALIKNGSVKVHDVGVVKTNCSGRAEEHFFINVAGFAFQGFVAQRIEGTGKWLKLGSAAFYLGLIDALFRHRITEIKFQSDGVSRGEKFFNISAGICRYAGGGMKLTPDAITDDNLLDVTLAGDLSKTEVIRNIFSLFNGNFVRHHKILQLRTNRFLISSPTPVAIETDGEVIGYSDAEVTISPKKIKVVVPAE